MFGNDRIDSWLFFSLLSVLAVIMLPVLYFATGGIDGNIWVFLFVLTTSFLVAPFIIVKQYLDPRAWYEIEAIVFTTTGTFSHEQAEIEIRKAGTFNIGGHAFSLDDLYRDSLKKKKWLYYYLMGVRARYLVVFDANGAPIKYKSPEVPAHVLYTARNTKVLSKGLVGVFSSKVNFQLWILIAVVVIAVVLLVSWLQSGGMNIAI